ncbi:autophagy-related protein 18h isoform X3 [Physcomitrium patens]|uniref:autophagy-related protein 18h isoform X3 n=1 Tax=Physcomitrium patens TaxID=3218 RepID=UPI003CCD8603
MRNDADNHVHSPRGGKFGSFPSSLRTISKYVRSVSANAGSIAASTVRQAAVSAASRVSLNEDDRQREQVQWSSFDKLELDSGEVRKVLLLTYLNRFQVWDVQDAGNVHELVSRCDGPVAFLRLQPKPILQESTDGCANFKESRPLLLVVTSDATVCGSESAAGFPGDDVAGSGGTTVGLEPPQFVPTVIQFYSLRNHSYVHGLRLHTGILAVRCSSRFVAVALASQICCFDAGTLQNIFSVLTYPSPATPLGSCHYGYGAMAVGPRWLAYAASQPLTTVSSRVSPQHLTPSPVASPSTSPANSSVVAHYAKESSKHIVAGVVALGDIGIRKISRYCSDLLPDSSNASPGKRNPSSKNGINGHSPWREGIVPEPEFAGTVTIRDIVSKNIVAQFRAHSSPLSALSFDPSGTLLVTASIYGHSLNVFRLMPLPSIAGGNGTGDDLSTTAVHLYKLSRGITNAVIQDISFSCDSHWIAVSSSRGTNHLYAISPFGGIVGPQTHGTVSINGLIGPPSTPVPAFSWWSGTEPLNLNQPALNPPPPAITLNVVGRIKNGNGGWRGTVTSAAVTATGRPNTLAGAVAAVFHDGGGTGVESYVGVRTLKDQLWVLCPTGHLLRYLLRPAVGVDGGHTNDFSQKVGMCTPGSPGLSSDLKVVVEPVERWDVARRSNWVEREECVETQGAYREEDVLANFGSTRISLRPVVKEGMTTEEMQRFFMSNAEVQTHQASPVPIWAKTKIQFHVMLSDISKDPEAGDLFGDEIEIENFSTRVVVVRRKDLVPVIERLQNFTDAQGSRYIEGSDTLPGVSNSPDQLLGDESAADGFYGEDLREVVLTDTPPSSFGSPPYFHQTPQGLKPLLVGRSEASHAHEHVSGTAEDAQTVDTKGFHSKTNGNENLDQGDDVLEEPMFPFCEDC